MFHCDDLIEKALDEDIGTGDLSSLIFPQDWIGEAKIYAKEQGVLCGIFLAEKIFKKNDSRIQTEILARDGDPIVPGKLVMNTYGPLGSILQAERTSLNFIQHLSGIATSTKKLVDLVGDLGVKVVDTRKTVPGMRMLQKYAVRVGGGNNHRFGLYDGVMLKDNHYAATGGFAEAIKRIKTKIGHMVKIEVECETLEQVREALACEVDIIMLDNMSLEDMREAVRIINHRAIVEASGGIRSGNIRKVAETGVDIISVGALTHSVQALDFSMVVDNSKPSIRKYIPDKS